jgi:hypothetical protein
VKIMDKHGFIENREEGSRREVGITIPSSVVSATGPFPQKSHGLEKFQ